MALTEQFLRDLMYYCRAECEDAEEQKLFTDLYRDAAAYLETAGVSEPAPDAPRFSTWATCVKAMVLDAYDRRGGSVDGAVAENPALRRRINQLKLTEPTAENVSDPDTQTETEAENG